MENNELHSKCSFTTCYGSIKSKHSECLIQYPVAVLVDLEFGTLLKVGEADWVNNYRNTMIEAYKKAGHAEMGNALTVVEFKHPLVDGKLDADEICTMINYLGNSIGEKSMKELLTMDIDNLKNKLKTLQEFGF